MGPAGCLQDRPRLAICLVELVVAAVGVGLQHPGVGGQMRLGMLAAPVARVVEHDRCWRRAAKRPVIADIDPESASDGLALGEHRYGRVVAVQPLGCNAHPVGEGATSNAAPGAPLLLQPYRHRQGKTVAIERSARQVTKRRRLAQRNLAANSGGFPLMHRRRSPVARIQRARRLCGCGCQVRGSPQRRKE